MSSDIGNDDHDDGASDDDHFYGAGAARDDLSCDGFGQQPIRDVECRRERDVRRPR